MIRFTLLILASIGLSFHSQAQWTAVAEYPDGNTYSATSFVINGKAYVGGGNPSKKSFYSYDPTSNTWTSLGDIPGDVNRSSPVTFTINGKAYIGCGGDAGNGSSQTFYEYDPATDAWTKKSDFPGGLRHSGCYLSTESKGYIVGGVAGTDFTSEVWEYDPSTDSWTEKTAYPDGNVYWPAGFTLNGKLYVGTGSNGNGNFFEFDPAKNEWNGKTLFPGLGRTGAVGFTYQGRGFIGGGGNVLFTQARTDFYEYNADDDSWVKSQVADFATGATAWSSAFVIDNEVYFGLGASLNGGISPTNKFYKSPLQITSGVASQSITPELEVFPNPSNGNLTISIDPTMSLARIEVRDMHGKLIDVIEPISGSIALHLTPGVYLARVFSEEGALVTRKKIVVQ